MIKMKGLEEMQRRMLRNYMATGIGLTVAGPFLMLLSLLLGVIVLVVGIMSIVRAGMLSSQIKRPPAS